jgi:polyisoprenoid-binding protein YceI
MITNIFPPLLFAALANLGVADFLPASSLSGKVEFTIVNASMEVTGTIENLKGKIEFDSEDLGHSVIDVTADPRTIQTGIAIRDKHLKRKDYFDVEKYPVMRMSSKSFRKSGKNKFVGQFALTIKDQTRTIQVPFTVTRKSDAVRYKGSFQINRLEFNLGEKSTVLDEKVRIDIIAIVQ